ncbi:MAG: hypothetical protein ACRDYV_05580, partial [Acidimicrobiia bacterium]
MAVEFGLGGAQQPDLGGDLRGQVRERDRGVAGVELDRRLRGGDPLGGPFRALVVVRRLGDQRAEPLETQLHQRIRVREAFQHRQVGDTEIARERGHGQQLTDQVLDAALVFGAGLGEPVGGPHPAIERG